MKLNEILTPTPAELREEFRFVSQSRYRNVKGVFVVDSCVPGPTVGITMQTHGNEPSGLAACWYARKIFKIWHKLERGRVMFVLNNKRAASRYFKAKRAEQKEATRFCDLNMNRLPEDLRTRGATTQYEIRRALELLPVWQEFTAALDIHSETVTKTEPMIIEVTSDRRIARLIRKFPMRLRFTDVERYQLRKPMLSFCGNQSRRIPAVGIETGSHENPLSYRVASACALMFIEANGLLRSRLELPAAGKRTTYRFIGRVLFQGKSWKLVKTFQRFEQVAKGQLIATGANGGTLRSPISASVIFPPIGLKPAKSGDEVFFLAKKVN